MSDTSLHALYNIYNSKPRSDVQGAVRDTARVNKELAEKHFIMEPDSSRKDVTREIFDKMTNIEIVKGKSELKNYLGDIYVQKSSLLNQVKSTLKETIKSNNNEEFINDMIK